MDTPVSNQPDDATVRSGLVLPVSVEHMLAIAQGDIAQTCGVPPVSLGRVPAPRMMALASEDEHLAIAQAMARFRFWYAVLR